MCVYTSNHEIPSLVFGVFVMREERDTRELDVVYINLSILGFYVNEHPAFFLSYCGFSSENRQGISLRKIVSSLRGDILTASLAGLR